MTIAIQAVTFGTETASKVEIFKVIYDPVLQKATANAWLKTSAGKEVSSVELRATKEQTDAWEDDETFYEVLIAAAGYTVA